MQEYFDQIRKGVPKRADVELPRDDAKRTERRTDLRVVYEDYAYDPCGGHKRPVSRSGPRP